MRRCSISNRLSREANPLAKAHLDAQAVVDPLNQRVKSPQNLFTLSGEVLREPNREGFEWGSDTIEAEIRDRVRGMIEAIAEEELESTLGAGRSQRVGAARTGYRHGTRERQLTTRHGKTTIMLPRARLKNTDGEESEWHTRIIARYQRRTSHFDYVF